MKRGFINGVGSTIKTIISNPDQQDSHRIDNNLKVLTFNQAK